MQHIHLTPIMPVERRADPRFIAILASANTNRTLAFALSGLVYFALGFFAAFQIGA